ncbi:protein kinase [Actinoplanes sp. NPDC051470]|uniref:serine/threonine-protein kinase n=1 Tax=Actinoplanes sp. NPDC051470 TaxID=3157224 RepID=UPI00341824C9
MAGGTTRIVAGRYRLVRRLGRGGMGAVWHAHDELLGRDVAIKEIYFPGAGDGPVDAGDPLVRRALREAQAAARLRHPDIITVHDVVTEAGRPWIVMELIDGRSLADLIRETGVVPAQRAAEIGLRVLDALRAAHRQGVLHRDVKPANILLDTDRVVLTDFGIAALDDATAITVTGQMIGSPAFMPPERINGRPATAAADLWSLGVTLYLTMTGRSPFHREDTQTTIAAILSSRPEPPAHGGQLWPVIKGLLEKDPERRLTSDQARPLLLNAAKTPDPSTPPAHRRGLSRFLPAPSRKSRFTDPDRDHTAVAPPPTLAAPTSHDTPEGPTAAVFPENTPLPPGAVLASTPATTEPVGSPGADSVTEPAWSPGASPAETEPVGSPDAGSATEPSGLQGADCVTEAAALPGATSATGPAGQAGAGSVTVASGTQAAGLSGHLPAETEAEARSDVETVAVPAAGTVVADAGNSAAPAGSNDSESAEAIDSARATAGGRGQAASPAGSVFGGNTEVVASAGASDGLDTEVAVTAADATVPDHGPATVPKQAVPGPATGEALLDAPTSAIPTSAIPTSTTPASMGPASTGPNSPVAAPSISAPPVSALTAAGRDVPREAGEALHPTAVEGAVSGFGVAAVPRQPRPVPLTPAALEGGGAGRRGVSGRVLVAVGAAVAVVVAAPVLWFAWSRDDDGGRGREVSPSKGAALAVVPSKASAKPAASKPVNPLLDPCLVGTWRMVSMQVINEPMNGVEARFTSTGGAITRIWPDGRAVDAWGGLKPLTATVKGRKWEETIKGTIKYRIETRGGQAYFSGYSGQLTFVMKRDGRRQYGGNLGNGDNRAPFTCSDTRMTTYGDDDSSTQSFTRVSRTP